MLVWVQGLSYYIMVSSTRNVINWEHISTILYNVSPTLKQPREHPCSNAKLSWQIAKIKCLKTRSNFALLYNASPTRTHKSSHSNIKVHGNLPQKEMCKLKIPLLYSRMYHKHIMLMSTKGTSILYQNAKHLNHNRISIEMQPIEYPWRCNISLGITQKKTIN